MDAFALENCQKPVTRVRFNNFENLEVELKHEGAFFNINELNALTTILSDVPCQERGFRALCNCWQQHQQYNLKQGFAEQFFDYVKTIDEVLEKVNALRFPEEFEEYITDVLAKLQWTKSLYLGIASHKESCVGQHCLNPQKLLKMRPRRLIRHINKFIQNAEKTTLIHSDWFLYQQSTMLARTYNISFSVE
ncbi:hypothetical protein [uncultured Microscilla sp.]|uniref:hypothetical protein n=1 Tax=uncultured Microscilla sp. TaxID=432653 RepID=UPI0026208D43|nr:hypothetical protein [uncultured Microscilla sp.]